MRTHWLSSPDLKLLRFWQNYTEFYLHANCKYECVSKSSEQDLKWLSPLPMEYFQQPFILNCCVTSGIQQHR